MARTAKSTTAKAEVAELKDKLEIASLQADIADAQARLVEARLRRKLAQQQLKD